MVISLASGCLAQGPFGSTVPFSAHPWLLEFRDSRRFVLWSRLWSTRMTSSWRASWWSNPSTSRSGDSVGSCWLRSISAASRLRATTPIPRSMCAWRSAQRSEVPKTAQGRRTPSVCRRHNVLSAWLHETRQRRNNGSAGLGGRWFEGLCSLMRIMSELPRRSSIQVFERKGPSYGSQFSSSVLVTLLRFDPVSDPSSGRPPLKFLFCLEVALPRGSWTFLFCRHIVPTIITWMAGEKKTCAKLNFKIPQQQLILPNDAVSALLRLNSGLMRKIGAWQILGVWLPNWRWSYGLAMIGICWYSLPLIWNAPPYRGLVVYDSVMSAFSWQFDAAFCFLMSTWRLTWLPHFT